MMRKTDCVSYSLAKPWLAVIAPALILAPTTLARVLKAVKAAVAAVAVIAVVLAPALLLAAALAAAAATALALAPAALARVLEAAAAATALVVLAAAVLLAAQALWHGLAGNKLGGRGWPVIAEKNSDTKNSVLSEIEKTDRTHDLTMVRRTDGTDTKIANKAVKVATAGNSKPGDGQPPRILPIVAEGKKPANKDLKKKATPEVTFLSMGDTDSDSDHDADRVTKVFASTSKPKNVQGRSR